MEVWNSIRFFLLLSAALVVLGTVCIAVA